MALNWRRVMDASSISKDAQEVKDLTVQYIVEETVQPVKDLARYVQWGCFGSVLVALGSLFGLIGVLRLLQAEVPALDGNLSWAPYLIVVALGAAEIATILWRVNSGPARRRRPAKKGS